MWATPPWDAIFIAALATSPSSTEGDPWLEPSPRPIVWHAPPQCPSHEQIRAEVERWVGPSSGARPGAETSATITIDETADGFVMELVVRRSGDTAPERRSLAHPDCVLLARAAVLMLAALDDPVEAATRTPPPPPMAPRAPLTARSLETAEPPPPPLATSSPPRRQRGLRGIVWAMAGPVWGLVPKSSTWLGGAIGIRRGALGVDAVGWHVLAAERTFRPDVGIRAELSGANIDLVFSRPLGPVAASVRLGAMLGVLRGGGTGSQVRALPTRGLWAAGAVGAEVTWPADGRLGLSVRAGIIANLRRPGIHLSYENARSETFRMSPIGASVQLGPRLRFP